MGDLRDAPPPIIALTTDVNPGSGFEDGYSWTRTGTGSYVYTFFGLRGIAAAVASSSNIGVMASTQISGRQVTVLTATGAGAFDANHSLFIQVAE